MLKLTKADTEDVIIIKAEPGERLVLNPCTGQKFSELFFGVLTNVNNDVLVNCLTEVITGNKSDAILHEIRLYPGHLDFHHEVHRRGRRSHIVLSSSSYVNSLAFNKDYEGTFFLEVDVEDQKSKKVTDSYCIVFSDAGFTINADDDEDFDPTFVPSPSFA